MSTEPPAPTEGAAARGVAGASYPDAERMQAVFDLVETALERRYGEPTIWDAFLRYLARESYPIPAAHLARDVAVRVEAAPEIQDILVKVSRGDPKNAELRRDLSVSYNKLGSVAQAGGDLASARTFFDKALELTKALSEGDPKNFQLQGDLADTHRKLSEVATAAKDPDAVQRHDSATQEIVDRMVQAGVFK